MIRNVNYYAKNFFTEKTEKRTMDFYLTDGNRINSINEISITYNKETMEFTIILLGLENMDLFKTIKIYNQFQLKEIEEIIKEVGEWRIVNKENKVLHYLELDKGETKFKTI